MINNLICFVFFFVDNIYIYIYKNISKYLYNTVGTTEIKACGDMNPVRDSAQEAHKSLAYG